MLDATDLRKLRHTRVAEPEAIAAAAARRPRRPLLEAADSRLMLLAADHPARGSLGVRGDPNAMADRRELLDRLVVALARPGVDGVLATADIVEDLLLLGALDGKIVIGSMNRGGLAGSVAELDDRFTAYDAAAIATYGLDGGKMLLRIDLGDPDTVATLQACGRAVTELAAHRRVAMVEPFMARRENGRLLNDLSPPEVIRACAIAAGLGTTSAYTWLKLPVVDDMERVLTGTTLPVLLLGGDPGGEPEETFAAWEKALALEGVYGLVVGRTLLYPPDGDVASAVDTATALVKAGQRA